MTPPSYGHGPEGSGRSGRIEQVSAAEVADLVVRLRALSAAGTDADDSERAEFLADKRALLDQIAAQHAQPSRENRLDPAGDGRALHDHRAALPSFDDDADGWVSGGYEAAHQAYLDQLGHVDARLDGDDPDELDGPVEIPEWMRQAALRELANPTPAGPPDDPAAIAARIQEVRDRLHAQALDEYTAHQHAGEVTGEQHHDSAERGWQR